MLNLFFQKSNQKLILASGQVYIKTSNNLDSHYYVLERIVNGGSEYLSQYYWPKNFPQILFYKTCWKQQETITQHIPVAKKPKQKKGIMGGLLNKKQKNEIKQNQKQLKEQTQIVTKTQEALYIQLQSFSEVNVPNNLTDLIQFMTLIYLLASKVYKQFNQWPKMIPVMTESKRYKFIKKGHDLNIQLVRLFEYLTKNEKIHFLKNWSQIIAQKVETASCEQEKRIILGNFLKAQLQQNLTKGLKLYIRKGQQYSQQSVKIINPQKLIIQELQYQFKPEEYEITYYHQSHETRQVVLQHYYHPTLILEADRNNLIIQYLKQFVNV